jgi:hypothetical protein
MVKYHEDCPEVAVAAWKQGYLTPLQLFRIAAWKTGQALPQSPGMSVNAIQQQGCSLIPVGNSVKQS